MIEHRESRGKPAKPKPKPKPTSDAERGAGGWTDAGGADWCLASVLFALCRSSILIVLARVSEESPEVYR